MDRLTAQKCDFYQDQAYLILEHQVPDESLAAFADRSVQNGR